MKKKAARGSRVIRRGRRGRFYGSILGLTIAFAAYGYRRFAPLAPAPPPLPEPVVQTIFRAIPFSIPTVDGLTKLTGEVDVPLSNQCDSIVKPIPAVLMVPGTGKFDRDEDFGTSGTERDLLFKQIAERLIPKGIAAIRFDYRGVHCNARTMPAGKTADDFPKTCVDAEVRKSVTPANLRQDVRQVYEYATRQIPCVDPQRLTILAHSEGSIHVAALVKQKEIAPSALLFIGMVAESPRALIEWQATERPISRLTRNSESTDRFLNSELKRNGLEKLVDPAVPSVSREELAKKLKADYEKTRAEALALPDAEVHDGFWSNRWWKMWWNDDVRIIDELGDYKNEIVVHLGDIDEQVPGPREESVIKAESAKFKTPPKVVLHHGLGHSLGTDPLEGPIADEAMRPLISDLVRLSGLTEKPEEMPPVLTASEMEDRPYFGFTFNLFDGLPADPAYLEPIGLKALSVIPAFPAWEGGVRPGDILLKLNGTEIGNLPKAEILPGFIRSLQALKPGTKATLTVLRFAEPDKSTDKSAAKDGKESPAPDRKYAILDLSLEVKLPRKIATDPPLAPPTDNPVETLSAKLAKHYGIEKDYDELKLRLANVGTRPDPFRLTEVNAIQHHPFAMRTEADVLATRVLPSPDHRLPALHFLNESRSLLAPDGHKTPVPALEPPPLKTGLSPKEHLAQIRDVLKEANALWDQAFAALRPEEIGYLREELAGILSRFETWNYLYEETDPKLIEKNGKVISLAAKVSLEPLIHAAIVAELLTDPVYVRGLKADLAKAGLDLRAAEVLTDSTPYGQILIGGTGDNSYTGLEERGVAVLIDLGGNDFYANRAGTSHSGAHISVIADLDGDNVYESSVDNAIGTGLLGVGIVANIGTGTNRYTGVRITQGVGVLGVGLLISASGGNEVYRAHTFAQGASFYGVGALVDLAGNDRYDAHMYAQGAAIAGGTAALIDLAGDDEYFASGYFPSGYSTPGTYQGWSQGVGIGVRNFMSGGVGLLIDAGGPGAKDHFQAGDFSQGGGYYFGWGILRSTGSGKRFTGSRYSQGFSAHYALGTFLGDGSKTVFDSRGAVSTGNANDMSVSWFENRGNDNHYPAKHFSLGAAANNSISTFLAVGKNNRLDGTTAPADSLQNDYHGRGSFALYLNLGGETRPMECRDQYSFLFRDSRGLPELVNDPGLESILTPLTRTPEKP